MGSLLQMKSTNASAAAPSPASQEFDRLLARYMERFRPADPVELGLVQDMVNARWRQRCYWRAQGEAIQLAMEMETLSQSERVAALASCASQPLEFVAHPVKTLKLTRRNAEIYRRAHEKALTALMELRDSRPPEAA